MTGPEISQIDIADFMKNDILVVCAYTYEGAMPEEELMTLRKLVQRQNQKKEKLMKHMKKIQSV